jgi:DNA polymerase-3 subunit epsilon
MSAVLAGIVLVLAVLALLPHLDGRYLAPAWVIGSVAVATWLGLIVLNEVVRSHLEDLKALRAGVESVAAGRLVPEMVSGRFNGCEGDLSSVLNLVNDFAAAQKDKMAKPDQRLAAVLRALHDGVVVVTETGLVSLVNGPAKVLLGGRVGIGGSIYSVIDRETLVAAVHRAERSAGRPVDATLRTLEGQPLFARLVDFGEHRGVVVTLFGAAGADGGEVELALDLHDEPPPAPAPRDDTLLSDLPGLVLDTETTGLDIARDAIVSVGAVRCHGARVFRSTVLDLLVDPGRRIPSRSTAVHGIDDAMVAGKPKIDAVLPQVLATMDNTVVVGHHIGFDLALLRRAAAAAGIAWTNPLRLDIRLLAEALEPEETAFEIDDQAARLGVNVSGRHTALGDSLVTAELWVRLIPQLERRGVRTLGEARAFARTAVRAIARQRDMGWDEDQ